MTSTPFLLAVSLPFCGAAFMLGLFGLILFVGLGGRGFQLEKAEGRLQPYLWILAIAASIAFLTGDAVVAISQFSQSGPRITQDEKVALVLMGFLTVCGGLLWVARTVEGGRIIHMLWLFVRYGMVALCLTLFVLYVLFGAPRHH